MPRWLHISLFFYLTANCTLYCVAAEKSVAASTEIDAGNPAELFTKDDSYIDECGTCHIAYPPMLLPAKSWLKLMSEIENHFQENAELDAETSAHISEYLTQNSMDTVSDSTVSHWLTSVPTDPPIRITELPAFITDHEDAYSRMGESAKEAGFFSPCRDCHKEANDGIFSKDRLFRGFRHVFDRFSDKEEP